MLAVSIMLMQQKIIDKLNDSLQPSYLEVVNESHKHQGHSGDDGSGESHFKLTISAKRFDGMNRVESQRLIYEILKDEMKIIHALSVSIKN